MKVLIVPDIHLGSKSFGKDFPDQLNSRIQDQFSLMEFVYDKAVENKIDQMILLGDVFDKEEPEPILISSFFKWLSKCTDHFLVDIVCGNHDIKRSGKKIITILDAIGAARIKKCALHKEITTICCDDITGGLSITYIPFVDLKMLPQFDKNKEAVDFLTKTINNISSCVLMKRNIAVGHLAIEGSFYVGDEIPDEHNELFMPISAFKNFDYTWQGHVHAEQILSKKPFVAHLGSLDKKTFTDKDKFICLYDSKSNKYEYIKLPCRNLVDISINVPSEVKDTAEYVKNEIQKFAGKFENSITRIKVETNSADAESINKKEIQDLLHSMNVQYISEIVEKKKMHTININTDIDETSDPNKAVDSFLLSVDADEIFKQEIASVCKAIIKEVD